MRDQACFQPAARRHYKHKRHSGARLLFWLLIVSGCGGQAAQAAATCAVTFVNNQFQGVSGNAVVAPVAFSSLQNGERVSVQRNFEVYYTCDVADTTELGIGLGVVPGVVLAPGFTDIYTTVGMQALGLGFKADVYTLKRVLQNAFLGSGQSTYF